jgi:hypothetical protein
VQYAVDLLIMASEQTVLRGIICRLIEAGICYGIEIKMENTKVMRISRQSSPIHIIEQKLFKNAECFNYLGSMVTNNARHEREIKSRIAIAKAVLNKKNVPFTVKLDLILRNKQ